MEAGELYEITRTTAAFSGWWVHYHDEAGNEWYVPVAGWAECSLDGDVDSQNLYPIVPTAMGVLEADTSGDGNIIYLAGEELIPPTAPYSTAYHRRRGK